MTIDEIDDAIEQLSKWLMHPPGVVFSSEIPAVEKSIEALKLLRQIIEGQIAYSKWQREHLQEKELNHE